ncbi:MAG: hypothetical protein HC881_07045 [Leptolyngbyaceae cyanobacterium SL_7_1]|nr:hypothetical protein [Leptolyngbyaceae cyanobacterium SL_7_1]
MIGSGYIDRFDRGVSSGCPTPVNCVSVCVFDGAIAIEAVVLRAGLRIQPRKSVEYATFINFLSTVVGWLLFLNLQIAFPESLRLDLMNGIFFDRWSRAILAWVILSALVTFFVSFLVKLVGLEQLQFFLGEEVEKEPSDEKTLKNLKGSIARRNSKEYRGATRQANTILIANALSYSAISLILLLRLLANNFVVPLQ